MNEWREQWSMFRDDERFLFEDWIRPATIEYFKDKTVLECGCGGGQHTNFIAPIAKHVTAVDLNTVDIARERNKVFDNVEFVDADIATMDLGRQYDIVFCVGVIHHTDDPDITFANMYRHSRPGGKMIVWTYSAEGNGLVRYLVEPFRKTILRRLPRSWVAGFAHLLALSLYPAVYTIYRFSKLNFLPYHEYFSNFRKLTYRRNVLNVFDKLNAPQTKFTTLEKCHEWFSPALFQKESISIRPYAGVSYSLVGSKING